MTARAIRWLAEFDPRIAPGWEGDGQRALRTLGEVLAGAVIFIGALAVLCFGVVILAARMDALPR